MEPERMKIIAEDAERITMIDHFEGHPVRFYFDKASGQVLVNADDMAIILGYKNQHDLLSQDAALDILNEHHKQNPDQPFLTYLS
ncbi:hypothetical protein [Adhaeribacter terreus]|uniref:KTSC domain-containing protein n=1 Tax=Adhaeribacter terreus TaxID=529703 RepID=A0ABW0E9W1_9BACT